MDNSDKISLHIIGAKTLSYHGLLHLSTAFGFPTSFLLVGYHTKGGVGSENVKLMNVVKRSIVMTGVVFGKI